MCRSTECQVFSVMPSRRSGVKAGGEASAPSLTRGSLHNTENALPHTTGYKSVLPYENCELFGKSQ